MEATIPHKFNAWFENIFLLKTRYDYNLTIMMSPKPATDNSLKIQHCPISSKFDMWVDNDIPN
jgi:hypothetical protein